MYYLESSPPNGPIHWNLSPRPHEPEGLTIRIFIGWERGTQSRRIALQEAGSFIRLRSFNWIVPGQTKWTIDLDSLITTLPNLNLGSLPWLRGRYEFEPEIEREEKHHQAFDTSRGMVDHSYVCLFLVLSITPEGLKEQIMERSIPSEIQESLARFRADHPDEAKVAFVMMRFGQTGLHEKIVKGIKSALEPHGITGLRADDKQYHDDLFSNILTYLHGCGMGIAVFERIESDEFNPNVSLEVGYMMALRRPVCLLKDKTLRSLPSDLVGRLYKPFDPQDPTRSIPPVLRQWLTDKRLG